MATSLETPVDLFREFRFLFAQTYAHSVFGFMIGILLARRWIRGYEPYNMSRVLFVLIWWTLFQLVVFTMICRRNEWSITFHKIKEAHDFFWVKMNEPFILEPEYEPQFTLETQLEPQISRFIGSKPMSRPQWRQSG